MPGNVKIYRFGKGGSEYYEYNNEEYIKQFKEDNNDEIKAN